MKTWVKYIMEIPMKDPIIRKLRKSDVINGYTDTLQNLRQVNLNTDQIGAILDNRPNNIETYIAIIGRKVVGTVTLIYEQKFIHSGGKVAHLEDLSVHPDHLKCGIGGKLIEYCIKAATKAKCYKLILNCDKHTKQYYKRFGFRKSNVQMRLDLA